MVNTTITDNMIAVLILIFIVLIGGTSVVYIKEKYSITDQNDLDKFANSSIKADLETLGYEIEDKESESQPDVTDTTDNPFSAVGKVLNKIKALKNITFDVLKLLKETLTFVPTLVWWLIGAILSIILVMSIIVAWWGQGIKQ